MEKLIVDIDSELKRQFKSKCAKERVTMKDILIKAVKKYIDSEGLKKKNSLDKT